MPAGCHRAPPPAQHSLAHPPLPHPPTPPRERRGWERAHATLAAMDCFLGSFFFSVHSTSLLSRSPCSFSRAAELPSILLMSERAERMASCAALSSMVSFLGLPALPRCETLMVVSIRCSFCSLISVSSSLCVARDASLPSLTSDACFSVSSLTNCLNTCSGMLPRWCSCASRSSLPKMVELMCFSVAQITYLACSVTRRRAGHGP
mmetsp:Transcript_26321/g.44952  ORF Transcript_26321/g.44952 Transcript_26321/m.44952 type:complete len:206 (-) Transcript_26321:541-1158(-)